MVRGKEGEIMSESFNRAVETCKEITKWRVSPYKCLYHNPSKYSLVEFARWTQNYLNCRIYLSLLATAEITGYEPVPSHLLNHNASRNGFKKRKVRVGRVIFYLIKSAEMSKYLKDTYCKFKELILRDLNDALQ